MKLEGIPFHTTDWATMAATHHAGETGAAAWRTHEVGGVRVRMVEYSPGYRADHWCRKGHVLLVLEGELETELEDGRRFLLRRGRMAHALVILEELIGTLFMAVIVARLVASYPRQGATG